MKEFWIKFKSNITLEGVVVKLILAWLLTSLIFAIKMDTPFMSAQFTGAINLGMYISFLLLFFVFFCLHNPFYINYITIFIIVQLFM